MGRLVSNGTTLYRRSQRLVRTPIYFDLTPDRMAVYQVPGAWRKSGNVWWPDGGFIDANTISNIKAVGFNCLNAYIYHNDSRIGWGYVNGNHKPETVWYQGAYATGATSLQGALTSCEAYIQLSAYHFTLPSSLNELQLTSVTVKYLNGGGIQCYQSPAGRSASNTWLQGFGDWGQFFMPFCVLSNLGHYSTINSAPYDSQIDILGTRYSQPTGARDLWDYGSSTRDGGIPTMISPIQQSYTMGTSTISIFNSNRSCWIIPFIPANLYSSTDYTPLYWNSNNGFWGCFSIWDLNIRVGLE